ncbi:MULTISPECIES: hypothetical protein [Cryobacterium]|uniref:YqaJ viral recombinase domain-containing protein n=1 Tax=Cryobacterium breve TaxID=1259258 RepID=A0ABY2J4C7_9MICO|nr:MULTISPECIES: hypothetical protein [Cryobacterium]TFC92071.1 hypothetical protein E3T20_12210 [Cryobacterium sp. TmT3-12]TFC99790.1 hypothetical protein E3O65_05295 [Cryobacterium breve]
MTYLDRILADSTDREAWLLAREPIVGASDAAKLARPESIDVYTAAKLKRSTFSGNRFTESGNLWEPLMLAWAGIPQNTLLIHAESIPGLAATPDGLLVTPAGIVLAEVKAKHDRIVYGPTPGELRQVAFQQYCVGPEVLYTDFIWAEIVNGEMRTEDPKSLRIYPADVADVLAGLLPIAIELSARITAALEFERGM